MVWQTWHVTGYCTQVRNKLVLVVKKGTSVPFFYATMSLSRDVFYCACYCCYVQLYVAH